jgi:hypothetical protein
VFVDGSSKIDGTINAAELNDAVPSVSIQGVPDLIKGAVFVVSDVGAGLENRKRLSKTVRMTWYYLRRPGSV